MAVKYVSSSADGSGDGTTTATSGANGAWTFAQMLAATPAAGDELRVMADGTYVRTATGTVAYANGTQNAKIKIHGANSSGVVDGTKPTIQLSGSTLTALNVTGSHVILRHIHVDGASQTSSTGIIIAGNYSALILSKVSGTTVNGITLSAANQAYAIQCEVTGASGTSGFNVGAASRALFCESYANTTHGFLLSGANATVLHCLSYSNTGGSSDGFNASSVGYFASHCVAYSNGRNGFDLAGNNVFGTVLANCWAWGNANHDYGSAAVTDGVRLMNCAGRAGASSGTGIGYDTDFIPAANLENYVTLTGDPATSSTNLAPNTTAGAGAALRAAGFGTWPRGTTVGYPDIGVQHQDSGGGGGAINPLNGMIHSR